jgi:predicted aspartyl protease
MSGLAAVAALAGSPAHGAKPEPRNQCVIEKIGDIPLEGGRFRPVVTALINGKPARLIVDTGSFLTILFPSSVAKLGLTAHVMPGMKTYGVGGASADATVNVDRLELGGVTGRNINLMVTGGSKHWDADGLIGAGFLLQSDLEFDMANRRLRFFKPQGCRGDQVVYWNAPYAVAPLIPTQGKSLEVQVLVNGRPVRAEIDSGSPQSTLIPDAAARAGVTRTDPTVKPNGAITGLGSQKIPNYVGHFETFAFGDEVIHNANLNIAEMFKGDSDQVIGSRLAVPVIDTVQMLLGADFLNAHRVYVAESQHRIYVSYAGGVVFATDLPEAAKTPDKGPDK